jgi:pimeloyl-ACP methyl ester carboxylesterase
VKQDYYIESGSVKIFAESFGKQKEPLLLLIMGATAQGVMWDDNFCETLASHNFFVVRYDHRDTGKSSKVDYSINPYYLHDLANDALSIINYFDKASCYLLGASMGSFVAKILAINHPKLIEKLLLVMSTPNHEVFVEGFKGNDTTKFGLPASNPKILEYYQAILSVSSSDPDDALTKYHDIQNMLIGAEDHLVKIRIFEGRILKRLKSKYHIHNHSFALANTKNIHHLLNKIQQPTLIVHGKEDYILPVEHGRLLAQCISNSTYLEYEGMGHCFTPEIFEKLSADIIAFLNH